MVLQKRAQRAVSHNTLHLCGLGQRYVIPPSLDQTGVCPLEVAAIELYEGWTRVHLRMIPVPPLTQKDHSKIPALLVVARSVLPGLLFCVCDPYGTMLLLQCNV